MSPRRPRTGPGPRLGLRVFGSMCLVVLAGAGTLMVVALLVAPQVFGQHLSDAGATVDAALSQHIEEGFAIATVTSIAAGVVASVGVAAGVALLVSRRISEPVTVAARTAAALAAGDYGVRVTPPKMGPELAELATAVNSLARRLEDSEATRNRLLSDLAHQLRTPLASIDATVEAIADGVLPADALTLSTLTEQSARVSRLVEDIAAVSRAQERAFRLDLEDVDLVAVGVRAAEEASARFAGAEVLLVAPVGTPVIVAGDAHRLAEVVGQLLDNALAHTPPNGEVRVGVRTAGDFAELRVTDSGSGFDPRDCQRLFERFYRGHDAAPDRPGSGIGLTIARALIEAHSGTLVASSRGAGTGAAFTLALPLSPAHPNPLRTNGGD